MGKINAGKSSYIRAILISIVLVFLILVGFLFLKEWEEHKGTFLDHGVKSKTIEYNGVEYTPKTNIEPILLLGLDKFGDSSGVDSYNNDMQADFLMLFVFDNDARQCSAVQINRDTMVGVNILGVAGNRVDTQTKQIALAHTYGNGKEVSCRNTADSVSSLLMGVNVNHYISLTMDAVAVLNDLVGGVEVTVLDDFSQVDPSLIKGETVTLKGEQALRYIRVRKGLDNSTNIARMRRQNQYINALYDKLRVKVETDEEFTVQASLQLSESMVSDRSATHLQMLVEKFNEYEFLGIKTIEGEIKTGEEFLEFYPDETSIKQIVLDMFYEPIEQ